MHPLTRLLFISLLCLTVVPGRWTMAKAEPTHHSRSQSLALPSCAQAGLQSAAKALGCSADDTSCLCSATHFLHDMVVAIRHACDKSDRQLTRATVESYCAAHPGGGSGTTTTHTTSTSTTTTLKTVTQSDKTKSRLGTTSTTTSKSQATATGRKKTTTTESRRTTSTGTPHPTGYGKVPLGEGGRIEVGLRVVASGLAVAGMSWIFAEW